MILNNEKMLDSVTVLSQAQEKGMLGYAIAKNLRLLVDETREFSQKREELIREHGIALGDDKYQLPPENAAKFYEAIRPYSELTADVAVMQVSPEVFYGGNLTSQQMFILDWMVKE